MNREVLITLIGCAIIFAGVGFFAYHMNTDQMHKPQAEKIPQQSIISDDTMPKIEKNFSDSTKHIKINDNTSIEKSTITLSIPANNTIPWGIIKGAVTDPAVGHPVIIQFFKSLDDSPVHVAQVNMNDNNTFEYKFRLLSIDDGITTHFFSGDYFIKIFKTVNTPLDK
jgi:hypothetical protein